MDSKSKKPTRPVLGRGLAALISSAPIPVNSAQLAPQSPSVDSQIPQMTVVQGGLDLAASVAASLAQPLTMRASEPSVQTATDDTQDNDGTTGVRFVLLSRVKPNPKQPRTEFNEAEIKELSDSIRTLGVLQPVLVRPSAQNTPDSGIIEYEIVAGERRWRAAQRANLAQLPVIIKDLDDLATLEIALVENIQRAQLSAIEEARAYQRLADEFSLSQKEIAERVGKDRASVANYMRLLGLPPAVLELLQNGQITMGHAKAILTVKEPNAQIGLAKKVVAENLSVRALEAIVSRVVVLDGGKKKVEKSTDGQGGGYMRTSDFPEVTDRLRAALGTKVLIRHHESGRGRIEIEYFSEQELDRLIEVMTSERKGQE